MKLETILKKKGYTDQEITDLAPLLSNAKFRSSLETELDAMEETVGKATKDLNEYDRWFTEEITPEHQALLKETADAKAEAAAAKARFETYQRTGMRKQAGQSAEEIAAAETERKATEAAARGSVDTSKFVDSDTFQKAFGETGTAIANGVDLMFDHQELFGTRLNMTKEMQEAKAARKPVRQYVEDKYKYTDKRSELSAKAEADKAEKYRQEGYQKAAVEFGSNPNTRMPVASQNPFLVRKQADANKQPWEKNSNELAKQRIDKAVQSAAARGELAN